MRTCAGANPRLEAVVGAPQQKFGRTIPPSGNVVCQRLTLAMIERARKPKVAQLERVRAQVPARRNQRVRVDEEVLGLDVAVYDVVLVTPTSRGKRTKACQKKMKK